MDPETNNEGEEDEQKKIAPPYLEDTDTQRGVYDDRFEQQEAHKQKADRDEPLQDVRRGEEQGSTPTQQASDTRERSLIPGQEDSNSADTPFSFNPMDQAKGLRNRLKVLAAATLTKRNLAIGGGGVGIIGIIFAMFTLTGSFELISLRENALIGGKVGIIQKHILDNRRNNSLTLLMKRLSQGDFEESINNVKFQEAFQKQGFTVEFDGKKLTKFEYTASNGETRNLDLTDPDFKTASANFFEGEAGAEAGSAVGKALQYDALTWKGRAALNLYTNLKETFNNWLGREPSDQAQTDQAKISDELRHANDPDPEASLSPVNEAANVNVEGPTGKPVSVPASNDLTGNSTLDKESQAYGNYQRSNPNNTDVGAPGIPTDYTPGIDAAAGEAAAGLASNADKTTLEHLLSRLATKLPGTTAEGVARGLQLTGVVSVGCRVRGTLAFIANVRNVLLTVELAKFALKFLSAADHQKAGLLQAESLKILLLYMHTPNPETGKNYSGSGGMQQLLGDSTAKVNTADISRYSVGRSNTGILGAISTFVNKIPGVNNPKVCTVTNNGFFQVGSLAVGLVVAFFGGSETGFSEFLDATTVGLVIAQELAFQIGTPILIKTGAHMVFTGVENGEMVGDGLASGIGSLRAMNGGSNGLRPVTTGQLAALQQKYSAEDHYAVAHESLFQRYLSPTNPDSMLAHIIPNLPVSFGNLLSMIPSWLPHTFNILGNFTNLFSIFAPGQAKAAAAIDDTSCNDPQVVNNNIATDAFCNPVMAYAPDLNVADSEKVLKANNLLNDSGQPQGAFADYIQKCFTGRPDILYNPNPSKFGTNDATDNTCITPGDALPGDTVGQYDRFSNYFGYLNDREDILSSVNGSLGVGN